MFALVCSAARSAVVLVLMSAIGLVGSSDVGFAKAQAGGEVVFAQKLVAAAREQRTVPVIYDPSYRQLEYPMGDVPWYVGVCTDVVIRAYRKLGIDLQPLVHRSRLGSGDRNIDHRRVRVLKKYFSRYGTSLKVSKDPGNYMPGDLVTYYVPDGTFSKTHIAIVSDKQTLAGVPFVIHNRGYGVREEDWLFGSEITGHYRFKRAPNIEGWSSKAK
ncbi:MAG: DUF1287 domain-containing protein [Filomicrobium sp.]